MFFQHPLQQSLILGTGTNFGGRLRIAVVLGADLRNRLRGELALLGEVGSTVQIGQTDEGLQFVNGRL